MRTTHRFIVISLLVGVGCSPHAVPETHLLPDRYVGQVYIVFDVARAPETPVERGRRIYRIPADGVLFTHSSSNPGWSRHGEVAFEYANTAGRRTPIVGRWYSTVHDTPETRHDMTVGVIHG